MSKQEQIDLYDGVYEPKPFVMAGDRKMVAIIVAIVAAVIAVIVLGNTVFSNANEEDIKGVFNFVISIGVGFLTYRLMTLIAKLRYKKQVERERADFEKKKLAAVPYTVCEFCGGRIERKYYKTGEEVTGGWYVQYGTLKHNINRTESGIDTYSCEKCRYIVECEAKNYLLSYHVDSLIYLSVKPEVFSTSTVDIEELKQGRLVDYLKSKVR